jgi:3-deoxy-manno-octulosonate cytidylyltransferase (CMP-KDO synthetase)
MKTLAIIPARYGSTRFPGKPLIDINGKTMIRRVYEKAESANSVDKVIVATDDQRIYDHVISFGGAAIMTGTDHQSGTDRCGEVVASLSEYGIIINLQGDEPFIPSQMIDELVQFFKKEPNRKIATFVKEIENLTHLFNPNTVKAVIDIQGNALYFSRQPIPYQQGVVESDWLKNHTYYKHIGMYIFDRNTLLELVKLQPSKLEKSEKLEQLRWVENGFSIGVGITTYESIGIDTPEDLSRLRSEL